MRAWQKETYQATSHASIVYAVTVGPGRVKVGITVNKNKLLTNYRRVVPDAQLIWETLGGAELEKKFHAKLADYALPHVVSGRPSEVFLLGDDLDIVIKTLDSTLDGISQ